MEIVKSTFNSLLKTLAIPIPILTTITVALIIGQEEIGIENFTISKHLAVFFFVILLLVVYLQCYRSVRVLVQSINTENGKTELVSNLTTNSSIFNPFLSTATKYDIKPPISDYLGTIVNSIPPVAIAVFYGIVLLGKSFEEGKMALEKIAATGQFTWPWMSIVVSTLYVLLACLFYVLYFFFLLKIADIMDVTNPKDAMKRVAIMGSSVLTSFAVAIIFGVYYFVRHVIDTISMMP